MATLNVLEHLQSIFIFSSRDWSTSEQDAYLYGIIVGWGDEEDLEAESGVIGELVERFGWDEKKISRMKQLHEEYQALVLGV